MTQPNDKKQTEIETDIYWKLAEICEKDPEVAETWRRIAARNCANKTETHEK